MPIDFRQCQFPKARLYSTKASKIISETFNFLDSYNELRIARKEDGEVKVEYDGLRWNPKTVEEKLSCLGGVLLSIAKKQRQVNTAKSRAADGRDWNGFAMKDLSLLGYILCGRDRKSLVANFGENAVDEMTGKPCDPLKTVKNSMTMLKIKQIKEEMSASSDAIVKKYRKTVEEAEAKSGYDAVRNCILWDKRQIELNEMKKAFEEKIDKLYCEIF